MNATSQCCSGTPKDPQIVLVPAWCCRYHFNESIYSCCKFASLPVCTVLMSLQGQYFAFHCHLFVMLCKGCSLRTQKIIQDKLLWCKQMIACLCSVRFRSVLNEMHIICNYFFIMTPRLVGLLLMLSSNTVLSLLRNMFVLKQL